MPECLSNRIFHGKLLLLGEHSVIDGSKAVVVPYSRVSGCLAFQAGNSGTRQRQSIKALYGFATFLMNNRKSIPELDEINTDFFIQDLDQGMYFLSTIPENYGLGSSGAVCSAVYHQYGSGKDLNLLPANRLQELRMTLAAMESYFHGRSSGVDPLCIYCDKPLIIEGYNKVNFSSLKEFNIPGITFFLLDTGQKSNTGDLVITFRRKLHGKAVHESYTRQYIPLLNQAVDQFAGGLPGFELLLQLSVFQWVLFKDMIPEGCHELWQYGLESEYYACKLCGSGGGGYILGFTEDFEKARIILSDRFGVNPVKVELQHPLLPK